MRLWKLTALIFVCYATPVAPAGAQDGRVRVKFEVDGKEVSQKFKILLYVNGEVIEPPLSRSGFVVPPEVKNSEAVNVRFAAGGYDLFFDSVRASAFETDWVVGVDNAPFDEENASSEEPVPPGKDLSEIYYITFVSKKGLDTRLVFKVYRERLSARQPL